jgi:histidine ammonia-lyase
MADIVADGESLTPEDVARVAREGATVSVPEDARERVRTARERVADVVGSGEAVYGINTGFGDLVDTRIPSEDRAALQRNLVRSHASGAGRDLDREEVRALMLTRINALVKGHSGVRERVIDQLVTMLNEGVHPVIRSRGSLGASGDLAPLADMALALIGEGEVQMQDRSGGEPERLDAAEALDRVDLEPLELASKEGLALVNGTQLTLGIAALAVVDAERLCRTADLAGALTTEVTMGTTASCARAIQEVRPHAGQTASARAVRRLTADSEIVESHRNCDRVQDAYSIRCIPQVHGAVRDAVDHLREAVETELNSATDNPLVFDAEAVPERTSGTDRAGIISGGNFHGEPLALRLDYLVGALTELAAISERRTDRMLNPHIQEDHLPAYLTERGGLHSGLMIAQYTAAAMVNECRSMGRPTSDNTPVSGGQEDHVSMSAGAAFQAQEAIDSVRTVLAVELLCGAQAREFVDQSLALGRGTRAAYETLREVVEPLGDDRPLHADIESVEALQDRGLFDEAIPVSW